jgi:hypothetical protein
MLGVVLERACQRQHFGLVGVHGQQRHTACGDGARLVEDDGVDRAGGLQHLRPLDEDAELRAAPGVDQQRGRSRQAEGARAGDDEDGDGGGERGGQSGAASK